MDISYIEERSSRRVWRDHRCEILIESKTGMKCVGAWSIKSAIEFVFAHIKDTWRLVLSGKPITYGVTRIPSTFGGGLFAWRVGWAIRTERIFIQVQAVKMRNILVLLYLVKWVFLSFWTSYDACFVQKSESPLCVPWASFYTQMGCYSGTHEVASYSGMSLSLYTQDTRI